MAVLVAATFLAPVDATAQDALTARSVTFGLMTGREDLVGSYRGAFKPGIVLGASAQWQLPMRRAALRGDFMYHWIGERGYVCIEQGCIDQHRYSHLASASLDLVVRLKDPETRWSPYLVLGAALYRVGSAGEKIASYGPSGGGLQGGVGVEVRPWKRTVFVELRRMGLAPGAVTPLSLGVRF